jgi:hypothetical protein
VLLERGPILCVVVADHRYGVRLRVGSELVSQILGVILHEPLSSILLSVEI